MASISQTQFFYSFKPIKTTSVFSPNPKNLNLFTSRNFRFSSSLGPANAESSSNGQENQTPETDPVKLAFAKAQKYKESIQSQSEALIPDITQNPVQKSAELGLTSDGDGDKEVSFAVRLAMQREKEYKEKKVVEKPVLGSVSAENPVMESDDKVKETEVPLAVKIALDKAKEYKKNKGAGGGATEVIGSQATAPGLEGSNRQSPQPKQDIKNTSMKDKLTVSSIDFVGLNFSDKKTGRGLPPGLVPVTDPFPEGDLPEVEILVGDKSKFGEAVASPKPTQEPEEVADLYKPKVSTWGVFPRPGNISKTYGGGRTIRPGDTLETAEDRAAKDARTKQLLFAYKRKTGLTIDPKLKSECEKALKDGDSLMYLGKLREALPFYERVMEKLAFQTELHGLAALQWSICQDSLSRLNEAQVMYEKLQSHPIPNVSKKAREFMFGFQAMEMMKITRSTASPTSTGYQDYFEAFVKNKASYPLEQAEVDESSLNQALPYVLFLVSPILVVLLIAASRT